MIRIGRTGEGKIFERIRKGLAPEKLDRIVDRVAFKTLAQLVRASPKKWFGQIRSGWRITKPAEGSRKLDIDPSRVTASGTSVADIAKFVDQGTANNGQGYIYPKHSKRLYIPLKRTAIVWREGLRYGKDYVLARRVKGIKGRKFVAPVRREAHKNLNDALIALVQKLKGEVKNG
jgi:hypothetical protein